MLIERYLHDKETNDILDKEVYSLDESYDYDFECTCGEDSEYCDCEGPEPMGCADFFTQYSNNRVKFNTLEISNSKPFSEQYEKAKYIIEHLGGVINSDNTIVDEKYKLIFYFRILRLCHPKLNLQLNLIYQYITEDGLGFYDAILKSILIIYKQESENKSYVHEFYINPLYITHTAPYLIENRLKHSFDIRKKNAIRRDQILSRADSLYNLPFTYFPKNDNDHYKKIFEKKFMFMSGVFNDNCLFSLINKTIRTNTPTTLYIYDKMHIIFKKYHKNIKSEKNDILKEYYNVISKINELFTYYSKQKNMIVSNGETH